MNTISKISEYIQGQVGGGGNNNADTPAAPASVQAPETQGSGQSSQTPDSSEDTGIQSYSFGLRELPNPVSDTSGLDGQTYLITMDNQGFGRAVAELIKENKGRVICVGNSEEDDYTVDLNALENAEETISRIKADHEGISGVFSCIPWILS